ncbi:outer membrane protein [Brevundimonas sp.]|uniref:outer membrane protein n=1 Tax=Brevundimonas sp. TaxID=1871086 RepID=UPI002D38B8B3|nr:outer membrane beta-barrel protein [Brevundimonas sp.]HYC96531.1 outer membrane beta-barrel protein [Brevundimonas sp.]
MKQFIALAAVAAAALATPAMAQDNSGRYVQVNLGGAVAGSVDLDVVSPPDTFSGDADLESGLFASIAAGTRGDSAFSVEGEVLYVQSDIDTAEADAIFGPLDASVSTVGVLANVMYNFSTGGPVAPYVGAGVGWGMVDYEVAGESEDDSSLIWQAKAGVTIPMSETMTWDIGYRYIDMPTFEISDGTDSIRAEGSAHVVSIGARFVF